MQVRDGGEWIGMSRRSSFAGDPNQNSVAPVARVPNTAVPSIQIQNENASMDNGHLSSKIVHQSLGSLYMFKAHSTSAHGGSPNDLKKCYLADELDKYRARYSTELGSRPMRVQCLWYC